MLGSLKRLFARGRVAESWHEVQQWARGQGYEFRRAREDSGFVIEGLLHAKSWRLEWGPSQREYIIGPELRLRIELGLPNGMQLLVLARPLMLQLERDAYEKFTDGAQTRIDTTSPEEMRWLAMLPHYAFPERSTLGGRVGAVGHPTQALERWLPGPLSQQLEAAGDGLLAYPTPFVLIVARGRLSLRCALPTLSLPALQQALALFTVAAERAVHAAEGRSSSGWPTTTQSA